MITARALAIVIIISTVVLGTRPAEAQSARPSPAIDLVFGGIGFADDGIVWEGVIGAAARFYVLPRLGVGPELTHIQGGNHTHLVLTGNVTFDVLSPTNGRPRPVTPYIVAGVGLFQTREEFFGESFNSSEGAFTVGGGVRALVSDRVTVGVDARLGWELHIRLTGSVGVLLGR